ncbi:fungal-specific transcription factor domain-containing protein [Cyathus striatus]|nr:fungal-specific transcription factor domain-containing protein [Cyathus striatus]
MGPFPGSNTYFDHPNLLNGHHHQVPVKTEASSSPDLSPAPASVHQFHFKFHSQSSSSHGSLPSSRNHSQSPACSLPQQPIYRFGSVPGAYNLLSAPSWPSSTLHHHPDSLAAINPHSSSSSENSTPHSLKYDLPTNHHSAMSYSDEYDNDLADLPLESPTHLSNYLGSSSNAGERAVRRRSSKACDQCRKSKCKCERSGPNEPCKSCIMLGTPCTFLGPSRKRGPPKGYIDAIEARLHQTEALLGIMLASNDQRAKSLLHDIAKDPLAKEIIARVDSSPYGVKGRKKDDMAVATKPRASHTAPSTPNMANGEKGDAGERLDIASMHPSNDWQDRVSAMLNTSQSDTSNTNATENPDSMQYPVPEPSTSSSSKTYEDQPQTSADSGRPSLRVNPYGSRTITGGANSDDNQSPARRQRRRIGDDRHSTIHATYPYPNSALGLPPGYRINGYSGERHSSSPYDSLTSDSEDELVGAVGQLSLNEDEQVRYHGKASGLYLLGTRERIDSRNEGGIWRFPKARVWPPLPFASTNLSGDDEFSSQLPPAVVQDHLLDLYFTYVHPSFPVIYKRLFFDAHNSSSTTESPHSPASDGASGSPFNRRRHRVPTLLLLVMFSLAARYDETALPSPTDGSMWAAGDDYLDSAKVILDGTYSSSRPSTCQALLLMGYREIGIGAMAQAWTYIGMAIRMAQDLGMHRSADGWARVDLGGRLFGNWELCERKRIWYGCVIMDKYVSTYIGRPLMIFERDFDTLMPSDNDDEEQEDWCLHPSDCLNGQQGPGVPGRTISCFNASSSLSGILSMIVQGIYAVRPVSSRHAESKVLEGLLDKWYIELPEHLRYEPGSSKLPTPVPHVLTLHMQYWCAVLLLHRPFIRHIYSPKYKQSDDPEDAEERAIAEKSYELCCGAANHITSIVTVYPTDPQARLGFTKCMEALRKMEVVWPSAGRALELLRGAKVNLEGSDLTLLTSSTDRHKRPAEQSLDDSFNRSHTMESGSVNYAPMRSSHVASGYATADVYSPDGYNHHPQHASIPTISASSYRWPSDTIHSQAFNGSLSTNRTHSQQDQQSHSGSSSSRYPQYWNDYSTFPQLGNAYSGLHDQTSLSQHQQQTASQIYVSDQQYNVYNNQSFQNR